MQNRYYAVGLPLEDLLPIFPLGAKIRNIKQKELEESSFYKQDTIRLFTSYDQAKEYAYGLRHNAYHFSHYPKTAISRSKVRPIFTIDLVAEIELGEPQTEFFKYNEHYVDDHHMSSIREKELALNFYEIASSLINKDNIVRAEFFQSKVPPVEFVHTKPRQTCVIS